MNKSKTIFVSYRREDSADVTGRILDRLQERFGKETLFRDVDSIRFGEEFFEVIEKAITECDVVLVVIGRKWDTCQDESGGRRLGQPSDYVRQEVAAALRLRKRLIPVLVDNATMIKGISLPEELHPLLGINAAPVRPDPDFDTDIERLLTQISEIIPDLRLKELEKDRRISCYNSELRKLKDEMEQNQYETILGNRVEPDGTIILYPFLLIVVLAYQLINMLVERQFTAELLLLFVGCCWAFYHRFNKLIRYSKAKEKFFKRKIEISVIIGDEHIWVDENFP